MQSLSGVGTRMRLAALLACALLGSADAHEQDTAQSVQRRILQTEPLSHLPGNTLTALEVEIAPGGSAARHRHAGSQFVYVLSGSIRSQLNDGPAVVYKAGESWIEPAGVVHSMAENVSKTEPVKLLAVFIAPTGAELTTIEK